MKGHLTTEVMILNAAREQLAMSIFQADRVNRGNATWWALGQHGRELYRAKAQIIMEGNVT